MTSSTDSPADDAESEARRAHRLEMVWWGLIPFLTAAYWLLSKEPPAERIINLIIADVSFAAMAVTYGSKAEAAEAKKAGQQ